MQRDDVIDVHLLECRDGLAHILLPVGSKVESADYRMHFGNPRGCLGLLEGVGGCEFMLELVGDDRLGLLFLWQLVRIAADPMRNPYFHGTGREHLLKTPQPDLSCSEGVVGNERRAFSVSYSQVSLLQGLAVERTKIARNWWTNPFA